MGHIFALGTQQDAGTAVSEQRIRVVAMVDLDAVFQNPVCVRDVIGLVENDGVRHAQPVEPQKGPEGCDEQRADPAPDRAAGHRGYHPAAQLSRFAGRGVSG
jgi:hypothetical protein